MLPRVLVTVAMLLAVPVGVLAQSIGSVSLEGAVMRAMATNAALAAVRVQRTVDNAGVAVARERPNPEAAIEVTRETPNRAFGVAFPWELGGKRARRVDVALAAVRAGDASVEVEVARVRSDVRRTYFDVELAEARQTAFQEVFTLAGRARDTARVRFDAGDVPRLEVVEAELAAAAAEIEVALAEGQVRAARVAMNTLLNLPADATPVLTTPLDSIVGSSTSGITERATASHPGITLLDRSIDEQRARVALARAMRVPDLLPGATLTQGAQPEFSVGWRASVSLVVPLLTTHAAEVVLEQATLHRLLADRLALAVAVAGAVAADVAIVDAQRAAYVRYRDSVVPRAAEMEALAQDSYQLGQTGMPALLRALEAARDVRLRALDALGQLHVALADLEHAAGVPLP